MLKAIVALLLVSIAAAQVAGGDNIGIPLAPLPVPHDMCSVSVANNADLEMTAVAWGYDNKFWVTKRVAFDSFTNWTSIGGFFAGSPTVIKNANNDIVVFGRGADRKIWYKVLHGGDDDGEWVPLGGKLMSGRVTALTDPQGLIHVFARGKDSAVWEKRQFANGTEAVWGEWASLGGVTTSNIATVLDAEGIIHLFTRGVDGQLWSLTQSLKDDSSLVWESWKLEDGSITLSSSATISAKLNAQNLIEIVARGADKAIWHTRETVNDNRGVIWSPFKSLGGIFSSAATMILNPDTLLSVFGRGPDKGAWFKQQAHHPVDSPSDAWSSWMPLGGRFSTGIDVAADANGFLHVFGRGVDKKIWTRGQMYSNKTVGFFGPWVNLGGRFRPFPC
jgi:hypothetical protein